MMKKLLFSFIALAISSISIAQTDNSLPSNGNVGIGTLNPSAKLDVNGHMKVDSTLTVKDSIIIQKNARVLENMRIDGEVKVPNLTHGNPNDGEVLIVNSQGKLNKSTIGEIGDVIYSKYCPTDPFADYPNPKWFNDTNVIYVDCPQVDVGIGTSTPLTRLDVNGGIRGGALVLGTTPSNSDGRLHIHTQLDTLNSNSVLVVENNTNRILQLNNDGLLRAREIRIDAQQWADHVFDSTYVLVPLKDVEKYIEENKHLPEVPSEKQVRDEGIDLAEMNKILLQKVEELTLYVIELNKKVEELEENQNR